MRFSQRLALFLQQLLHSGQETCVVGKDIFADAQYWNATVCDSQAGEIRAWQGERLFADGEGCLGKKEVVARFLRIGRKQVVKSDYGRNGHCLLRVVSLS